MNIDRKCNNCTFNPCTRKECGNNNKCKYHKFEHEEIINKIRRKIK